MNEKAKQPKQRKTIGKTAFETTNQALVSMFHDTVHMLEETLKSGKLNPAQGLLGMMMVADLLHGGALTVANSERPYLVGAKSKYYAKLDAIGATDFYPIRGLNILDIVGSYFGIQSDIEENKVGQMITTEVYMNANCPHVFPKFLSDEAYAKVFVMAEFLSHSDVVIKTALGVKTFVEASAIPVSTLAGAVESVGKGIEAATPSGAQMKNLLPLLR